MKQKSHNYNLDILRWIAAITVVFHHLTIHGDPFLFDKRYFLGNYIPITFPGHLSVLVFFVLSGYVIGMNTKPLTDRHLIWDYTKKRLVRIFPIYLVIMIITCLFTYGRYSLSTVFLNLFCISVPFDKVIEQNDPIWSLNYELFYYFLFIFISCFRINVSLFFKLLLLILVALFVFTHKFLVHPLLISYFVGFIFWIAGAMLAKVNYPGEWKIAHSRLIALVVLIFCLEYFNPAFFEIVLNKFNIKVQSYEGFSWFLRSIVYSDITYLPLCILLILSLTHINYKYKSVFVWFIYGSVLFLIFKLYSGYGMAYFIANKFLWPAVIFAFSLLLWILNFNLHEKIKNVIKSTYPLSNISYAIYIAHYPLILIFCTFTANSWPAFGLKLLLLFAVIFLISYILEEKFQPAVRKILLK